MSKYIVVRLADGAYIVARPAPHTHVFYELCRAVSGGQADEIAHTMNERAAARARAEAAA